MIGSRRGGVTCAAGLALALVRQSACILLFGDQNARTLCRARKIATYLLPFRGRATIISQTHTTNSLRTNNGFNRT